MGMIDFAIDQIIDGAPDISEYVLRLAFDNPNSGLGYATWGDVAHTEYSIKQGIRDKVVYKMVAPLLNVSGGTTEPIGLNASNIKYMGNGEVVIDFPDTKTGGRDVISIIEVYPGTLTATTAAGYNTNSSPAVCGTGGIIGGAINRVANNLSGNKVTATFTDFTPLGRNRYLMRSAGAMIFNLVAKVILSYDEEFSIIPPRAYPDISELIMLGTKAYIYKKCRHGAREAVERFGVSLDSIRDEIESYSDAHREFKELFENKIRKILAYADAKGKSDALSAMTPRRI